MAKKVIYEGSKTDVTWDGRLCIHIGECGRANNELFKSGRDPWCDPDIVDDAEVRDVVERCPTGAISYHMKDGSNAEKPQSRNEIFITNNGPIYMRGNLDIDGAEEDMPGVAFRAALCRCGDSKRKPFCDNTHEKNDFRDRGAIGETGDGSEGVSDVLKVRAIENGPLLISGDFVIISSSGREAFKGTKHALCRCGKSANKPFCDGAHKAAGFRTDT